MDNKLVLINSLTAAEAYELGAYLEEWFKKYEDPDVSYWATLGAWDKVSRLIERGAEIAGTREGKSVLGIAKDYNFKFTNDAKNFNQDVFYLLVIIESLRSSHFEYPSDVTLTDEDRKIIENLKNKISLYIKIFIPSTFYPHFAKGNYYKKNHLNELPQEIRQLIAVEYIKEDLAEYNLSPACIKSFSNEIAHQLFTKLANKYSKAQCDFEKGPHFYELVLFSSILNTLRENSEMIDIITRIMMNAYKNLINNGIFTNNFLPAFQNAKHENKRIGSLDYIERLELYKIARQYGNRELLQKPHQNTLTENDFSAILSQFSQRKNITKAKTKYLNRE